MFKKEHKEGAKRTDDVETIIGPSVKIEGEFTSNGNLIVGGVISGKLTTTKHLKVEESAKIAADVTAGEAIIAGEIVGNLIIEGRLEILATAKINGDIQTGSISIQQGAQLNGNFIMKDKNSPKEEYRENGVPLKPLDHLGHHEKLA
jgi:cytoskeletal protein CcmA (bactofilin family)